MAKRSLRQVPLQIVPKITMHSYSPQFKVLQFSVTIEQTVPQPFSAKKKKKVKLVECETWKWTGCDITV